MPVDHNDDGRNSSPEANAPSSTESSQRGGTPHAEEPKVNQSRKRQTRRAYFNRRNALFAGIAITVGILAIVFVAAIAYRLGFIDRYVARQIKDTLATYGIRAETKSFRSEEHTSELQS